MWGPKGDCERSCTASRRWLFLFDSLRSNRILMKRKDCCCWKLASTTMAWQFNGRPMPPTADEQAWRVAFPFAESRVRSCTCLNWNRRRGTQDEPNGLGNTSHQTRLQPKYLRLRSVRFALDLVVAHFCECGSIPPYSDRSIEQMLTLPSRLGTFLIGFSYSILVRRFKSRRRVL